VPKNPRTGGNADPTNLATCGTFEQACNAVSRYGHDGIGFVFTNDDPFVGIDLDHCRDPETGDIEPWAVEIVTQFASYTEITPSGTGLHILVRGQLPPGQRRTGKIETYDAGRYFRMSGDVLRGFETIRDCGSDLAVWHAETFPAEPKRNAAPTPTLTMDDRDLIERLTREPGGKAARLLTGDATGYPSPSEARAALAWKICFYTDDADQVARLIRTSDLFKAGDSDRERDRKAALDATKAVGSYDGARYDPTYGSAPHGQPVTPPRDTDAASCSVQLAAARVEIAQLKATITRQAEQISTLQERARLADEREAIQRNAKLGTSRQTGAALATLFRELTPKEPDTPAGYRVPLAKLAERTGLSADTCSRQLRQLSTYRTDNNTPVLHVETRDVPRHVIQETGEIIEPHREVWCGPGVESSAFGYVLAQLTPADAPKHGGKPDRNVCPEHPDAGVLRRTKTTRKITRECAHCHLVLDIQVIPVGRESTEHIPAGRPTQHDAFAHGGDDPETADPIQHDAFASDTDPGAMPQHAGTMGNHTGGEALSGKMRHSSPQLDDEPPDFWIPPDDQYRYQSRHGEVAGADRWTG
jgi:hypothetical protein